MGKLITVLGYTNTGKSTLINELVEKENFEKITTYTTRPPREKEVDGKDYHFIKFSDFIEKFTKEDYFAEVTWYKVYNDELWFYGSAKDDYKTDKDQIVVLNIDGVRQLKKKGIDVTTIYLKAEDEELTRRITKRGDNLTEFNRRLKADKIDFAGLESTFDIVVDVTGKTVDEIVSNITSNPKWSE